MTGTFRYSALAIGLAVSGAVALTAPTLAGIPGGPLGQPQAALPLLIPVQDRGDPGGGPSVGKDEGGGGGETTSTPASAPATGAASPSVPQAALSPPVTQAIADSVGDAFDACRTLNESGIAAPFSARSTRR